MQKTGSAGLLASARPLPTGVVAGLQSKKVGRSDVISTTPDRPARSDDDVVVYDVFLCVAVSFRSVVFICIRSDGC